MRVIALLIAMCGAASADGTWALRPDSGRVRPLQKECPQATRDGLLRLVSHPLAVKIVLDKPIIIVRGELETQAESTVHGVGDHYGWWQLFDYRRLCIHITEHVDVADVTVSIIDETEHGRCATQWAGKADLL
jgi:hypothetical protein